MKLSRRRMLGPIMLLAALVGLAAPGVALGADPVPVAMSVSFRVPPVTALGSEVTVLGSIRRADRLSPTGLRVSLFVDGKFLQSSHADASGNLAFRVSGAATSKAGTFKLEGRFDGSRSLAPARATTTLKIRPAVITITTVPAVSGVPVSVGTQKATTGPDGTAKVSIDKVGAIPLEAHLDLVPDLQTRVSFIRWGDQVYDEKRAITVRGDATFVLGLRTAYRASVKFVDQDGHPVDPTTINRARFTSSTGGELVLTNFENAWWEAGTAVSRTGGLQPSTTLWRLSEVEMAGTNVVNQGQQAFSPTINGTWTVNLLLFDLVVHTRDAVTGSSLKGTAELVFPDSSSRTTPIASDGSARFSGLPRGSYVVKLGTNGIAPTTPIALSRSQEATIRVISTFDLALAGGFVILSLLTLLWIGRRRQLTWLMRAGTMPLAAARRLPGGSALVRTRRSLPGASSALAGVRGDLSRIGQGRVSAAIAFGLSLLGSLATLLPRVFAAAGRSVRSAAQSFARTAASASARRPETSVVRQTPVEARIPSVEATPSWPTPSPSEVDVRTVLHPPIIVRPATRALPQPIQHNSGAPTAVGSWFDDVPEEDGPTHECKRCHRQVLDSARFCRSCGHRQE
jgi:hypothetical protein